MDTRTAPTLPSGLEFVKMGIEGYEYSLYLEIWLITRGHPSEKVCETEPTFKFVESFDQHRVNQNKYQLRPISLSARKGRQEILVVTPAILHLLEL